MTSRGEGISARVRSESVLAGTPYRIVGVLGSGGMGTVYAAEHIALGTEVAVKIVHASLATRADVADRLRLEAESLAHLVHPNIVRVLDSGRAHDGRPFYVMPRLVGRTLETVVQGRVPLPLEHAVAIVRAILGALRVAHASGIVHRDVKPANVFLVEPFVDASSVKLLDFGIAKVLAESVDAPGAPHPLAFPTHESVLLGTPNYLAPELVTHGATSPAVDVYAAALVLYTLVCGAHPFEGRTRDAVLRAQLEEMPARPSTRSPHRIPPALDALIMRALAKDPRDRYRDARAMLDALDAAQNASLASELPTEAGDRPRSAPVPAHTEVRPRVASDVVAAPSAEPMHVVAPARATPTPTRRASVAPRVIGALCLVVAITGLVVRFQGVGYAVSQMHDPHAALIATYGVAMPEAEATIRSAAAFSALRHGLLALSAFVLFAVGVDLLRGGRRAAEHLRLWAGLALVIVVPAIAMDVFALAPRQLTLLDLVGVTDDAIGASMGRTFVFVTTAATALFELGFVLFAFVAAHRLRGEGPPP